MVHCANDRVEKVLAFTSGSLFLCKHQDLGSQDFLFPLHGYTDEDVIFQKHSRESLFYIYANWRTYYPERGSHRASRV
jgi:hypothetical protein